MTNKKHARLLVAQEGARLNARATTRDGGVLRDGNAADIASVVHAFAEELARVRGLDTEAVLHLAAQIAQGPLQ